MKRVLSALLVVMLAASLAACSSQPAGQTDAPPQETVEPSAEPEQTPEPTPEPTPEHEPYTPMEIFSAEFNLAGMDMPTTVFQATFNKGSDKMDGKAQYVLSMTGSGNMYAVAAYQADVAGLGLDDSGKMGLLEEYVANDGFLEFTGKDGRVVTMKRADSNDDRYEYVESDGSHGISGAGCVIDITYIINDADMEKYTQLVGDNYSVDALMPIADFFDTNTDFAECGITVNIYKDEARAYAVYRLPDVSAVMQDMQGSGDAPWWEWDGMSQTAMMYDGVESKLTFDTEGGAITVEQLQTELSVQPVTENSLSALGFGFDDAGTCGVYEQREPHYISVAIARPEWGELTDDWNIEFMDTDIKGYSLRITYHAEEGRYHISLDKDGEGCAYECYPEKNQYGWEYPDLDTVHKMFNDAFGTKEKELYFAPLEYLEQYVHEHFGMSVDELYAAPKQ